MRTPYKSFESQFVISGLQVQLLSLAPRKILRYTVIITACIVGFLLYHNADIARNVGKMWDDLQKMGFCGTGCTRILYAPAYIIRLYCGLLYAPAMGWERYLILTLYTRVSVRLTTPTQKSVSIDTSGNVVNLPDCTDLCNRLKIERVSMPSKLSVFQLRPFARSA